MSKIKRRTFIKTLAAGTAGISLTGFPATGCSGLNSVPSYLQDYAELYRRNPRDAALQWFKDSKFGLFMHYGISSILGRSEWVQYQENIPLKEYIKLKDQFTADKFDADFITDLALDAGMKYVNITARHHDSFCLFDSSVSNYTSVNSPSKCDLVGKLAHQCQQKGLGFFFYYSYALDWKHPYFYPRKYNRIARPEYKNPEDVYKWRKDEDFQYYIEFVHAQIRELLTNYGPIAGIWFDPIMGYYGRPDLFPIDETYTMIRKLQPQTLISFKQGATGTEDFAAPERSGHSLYERVRQLFGEEKANIAHHAWEKNKNKHNEICDTMQPGAWGYRKADDGQHHSSDKVIQMLVNAVSRNYNLLLNTGSLPDGSIHQQDAKSLRETGKWLLENGKSIYGVDGGPFTANHFAAVTYLGKTFYAHLLNFSGGKVIVPTAENAVKKVQTLDRTLLNYQHVKEGISINIPKIDHPNPDYVVKIDMQNKIDPQRHRDKSIELDIDMKYKSIILKHSPSEKYPGRGILTLQDGIRGGLDYNSGHWLGFEQDDFEAVVDLGKNTDVHEIKIGFLQNQKSWVFLPEKCSVYTSNDRVQWKLLDAAKKNVKMDEKIKADDFVKKGLKAKAGYIKIIAKNVQKCPDWHTGNGGRAWLFVDEIIIN